MRRSNSNGFSLITVLVGLAISGIIGVVISQVMVSLVKSQAYIMQRQDALTLQMNLVFSLKDSLACAKSFTGIDPSTSQASTTTANPLITQIVDRLDNVILTETPNLDENVFGAIKVHDIRFTNYQLPAGSNSTTIDLEVIFKGKSRAIGSEYFNAVVKLIIKNDPVTGLIESCRSFGVIDSEWNITSGNDIQRAEGNVGIGIAPPTASTNSLYVNGFVYSRAFYWDSDERLKKNIHQIMGLDIINKLRGVGFEWRHSQEKSLGFVAQEIEEVLPEIVSENSTTGMKSVAYGSLVAPLVESIKELDLTSRRQQSQVSDLKKMLGKCQSVQLGSDKK